MEIIEKFIEGKQEDQSLCEDKIFVSDDFIAVIDGATSKDKNLYDGKSSGIIAAENVKKSLETLSKDVDVRGFLKHTSDYLADCYKKMGIYELFSENPEKRGLVSMIIYSKFQKQIWAVADCKALVDGKLYDFDIEIDKLTTEARSCFIQAELASGKTEAELLENDTAREFILPLLVKQKFFMNNKEKCKYSFDVINGFNPEYIEPHVVDVDNAKEIILSSDGYPKLFDNLQKSEDYLKKIAKSDPLCYKEFKSTKAFKNNQASFDDRSYIKFRV